MVRVKHKGLLGQIRPKGPYKRRTMNSCVEQEGSQSGWYRGFCMEKFAPEYMLILYSGAFLCTLAPKGKMSAEADGCPAHGQGKNFPYPILKHVRSGNYEQQVQGCYIKANR